MTDLTSSNNKPAGLSRVHFILGIAVIVFVAAKLVLLLLLPRPAALASDLTTDNIMQAVNRERSLRNLLTLNPNGMLATAAQSKADDMQARHYFAHVDPDGNYIWPKIVAAGYTPYLQLGENLAIEFYDTESLVAAWMNSPTHCANVLNDGFKDQGMGLNFGDSGQGQYHSIVVNAFGTLLVKKAEAAPAPTPTPTVSGARQPAPTPKPTPKPASAPKPAPATTTIVPTVPEPTGTVPVKPLDTRGSDLALLPPTDYSGPSNPGTTTPATATQPLFSPPTIVNPLQTNPVQAAETNRYFTIAFGIALFLFLLTDLRGELEQGSVLLGKKINNLALLILALIVVAVMYWL